MQNSEYILTAIVPVSAMSGKLQNFQSWTTNIPQNIKIVVVHDRRDDATGEELKSIIAGKSNIQYIEGIYGTAGLARNAGLATSDSKWTTFWDSDDLPEPNHVLKVIKSQVREFDMIVTSFKVMSAISKKEIRISQCPVINEKQQLRYLANDPGLWRIIFKTDVISKIKFTNLKIAEDVQFLMMALNASNRINFTRDITYNYFRDVSGQLTSDARHIAEVKEFLVFADRKYQTSDIERNFIVPIVIKQGLSLIKYEKKKIKTLSELIRKRVLLRHPVATGEATLSIIKIRVLEKYVQMRKSVREQS